MTTAKAPGLAPPASEQYGAICVRSGAMLIAELYRHRFHAGRSPFEQANTDHSRPTVGFWDHTRSWALGRSPEPSRHLSDVTSPPVAQIGYDAGYGSPGKTTGMVEAGVGGPIMSGRHWVAVWMALSSVMFVATATGATALEHLRAAAKPAFRDGHTLPPLTRWGWAMPFDARVELTEHWGYALELGETNAGLAKQLEDPKSPQSKLCTPVSYTHLTLPTN